MVDEIYVIERHNDSYHGPSKRRHAKSLETALELAEEQREEHRGEEWELNANGGGKEDVTFHPKGESGWVKIKKVALYP